MVDNSTNSCKHISVGLDSNLTIQVGRCILSGQMLPCLHLRQAAHCHFAGVFSLHSHSNYEAWHWWQGIGQHFPHCPPSSSSPRCHRWGSLPIALCHQLATSLSQLHERYS